VVAAARANGVGVRGDPRVQAGALASALDRTLPTDHPVMRDYAPAAGFRRLAAELGTSAAALAHRYALSLPIDTMVLGVKNRAELAECVADEAGPLPADMIGQIDQSVDALADRPLPAGRKLAVANSGP
jgi:aryl-alcohol dehydrogenase-like predicted oxidoreductase